MVIGRDDELRWYHVQHTSLGFFVRPGDVFISLLNRDVSLKPEKEGKKMKLKNVILLAGMMMTLTGCGTSSNTDADLLSQIVSTKTLKVGTEATYPPFEYTDTDGNILGFDVEIVKLVEAKIEATYNVDINVVWSNMAFDGLIGAIQSSKVDLVAAAMTVNEERAKSVSFSDTYFTTETAVVVLEDNTTITSMDALKAAKCGSQLGTEQANYIQEEGWNSANQIITSVADLTTSLLAGKIEALVVDKAVGESIIAKNTGLKLATGISFDDTAAFGLATSLENSASFVSLINEALAENIENGTITNLYTTACDAYASTAE